MKNTLFLFFSLALSSFSLNAQFQLPTINYDKIEAIRKNDVIVQKNYKKDNQIILTVNFPFDGQIHSYCGIIKSKYDSIYLYRGTSNIQIYFEPDEIEKKIWGNNSQIIARETYRIDKTLAWKYKSIYFLDEKAESTKSFPCGGYDSVTIEECRYDSSGVEMHYYNFNNGEFRLNGMSINNQKYLELKQKADSILIEHYGKDIFGQHILNDFRNCNIYYSGVKGRKPLKKNYDVPIRERWWFDEVESSSDDVAIDFAYKLFLNNKMHSDITIRIDWKGELLLDNATYRIRRYGTRGLLNNPKTNKFLPENKVMKLALKNGFSEAKKDDCQIMWTNFKSLRSGKKELFYQICYDKFSKRSYSCNTTFCDAWLVSPYTEEIIKDKEVKMVSGCALRHISKKVKNGKVGFYQRLGGEILIPYEYDSLPKQLDRFMVAKKNGNYGCINYKNEIVIPFKNDLIQFVTFQKQRFTGNFVIVKKDGLFGLYNKKGEELLPVEYDKLKKETEYSLTGIKKGQPKVIFDFKSNVKSKYYKKK